MIQNRTFFNAALNLSKNLQGQIMNVGRGSLLTNEKEKMRGKQLPLLREFTFSLLLAFSLLS
jgi:hypothetical protein